MKRVYGTVLLCILMATGNAHATKGGGALLTTRTPLGPMRAGVQRLARAHVTTDKQRKRPGEQTDQQHPYYKAALHLINEAVACEFLRGDLATVLFEIAVDNIAALYYLTTNPTQRARYIDDAIEILNRATDSLGRYYDKCLPNDWHCSLLNKIRAAAQGRPITTKYTREVSWTQEQEKLFATHPKNTTSH